jgi:hypothetical protein
VAKYNNYNKVIPCFLFIDIILLIFLFIGYYYFNISIYFDDTPIDHLRVIYYSLIFIFLFLSIFLCIDKIDSDIKICRSISKLDSLKNKIKILYQK